MSRRSPIGAVALIAVLTACASGGGAPATTAVSDSPPAEVSAAFCELLDARASILEGEVGVTYHAAQRGDFDDAVTASSEIVLPALETMRGSLDTIRTWEPAVAFAAHAEPLVGEFEEAATAFVDDPGQETFDRTDVAGQELRDELFSGDFARAGPDLFRATCA